MTMVTHVLFFFIGALSETNTTVLVTESESWLSTDREKTAPFLPTQTSARCIVRPRPQFLIISPASFTDNPFMYVHEVAVEMM
jgi:hypothetical protein